jgi:gamma-glutamylputrescine oxidase
MIPYQSPVSPGRSWYEDSCGDRPSYPALNGDRNVDVAIIGGGYCGLSAALHLGRAGSRVALVDACRFGDGASGRNGGQIGFGQRGGVIQLEKQLGFDRSKALWDMAEAAKESLLQSAGEFDIEMDYQPGQLTPMHKRRYEAHARHEVDVLNTRYGYQSIRCLDRSQMAAALGSSAYYNGTLDTGTGHIHPMKYLIGLASAAHKAGVGLFENTAATKLVRNGKFKVATSNGTITADRVLLALNGYHRDFHPELASHVLPIQSFIAATVPLAEDSPVLPDKQAVDDSRFVVRYFRKSKDNRLLFGGREAYGKSSPGDIERAIRKQITQIFPNLAQVEISHAWGGNVAITMPRMPHVRELEPGLWTAGGFSGHGVMMANYTGRMIAECFLGKNDQIHLLKELKIPAFPGSTLMRNPLKILALTWYAMLDRL